MYKANKNKVIWKNSCDLFILTFYSCKDAIARKTHTPSIYVCLLVPKILSRLGFRAFHDIPTLRLNRI